MHPAPTPHPRRRPRGLEASVALQTIALPTITLALLCLALLTAPPAQARHSDGDRIEVKGLVTDLDGQPLDDVQVTLELSREIFDVRRFGRERVRVTPVTATTNRRGEYSIVFPWDGYYNRFDLVVSLPVRGRGGVEEPVELERQEITRRLRGGDTPLVVTLGLENASFIRNYRQFLAGLTSDDERRVFREQGRPDRVRSTELGERRSESSWWYFATGQVYRFENGRLVSVDTFDPVEPVS